MRVGVVTEWKEDANGAIRFPDYARPVLDYLADRHEVHVLDAHRQPPEDRLQALRFEGQDFEGQRSEETGPGRHEPELLAADAFELIYFGVCFKAFECLGEYYDERNCLSLELDRYRSLVDRLLPYEEQGLELLNPGRTLLENTSKEYLLRLARETDLPFIETRVVRTWSDLEAVRREKRRWLTKPLISERGFGLAFPGELDDDGLERYFERYVGTADPRQGLLAQPFLEDFVTHDERKYAVVHGEVTLARCAPVTGTGVPAPAGNRVHEPSPEELDLALAAYRAFDARYPAAYVRVDIMGCPGHLKINEIEAINPHFGEGFAPYTPEAIARHHDRLFAPYSDPGTSDSTSA